MSDSAVLATLAGNAAAMERVLRELGCEVPHGIRQGRLISCPMPDHPDANPSCNPLVESGTLQCFSGCGNILISDLVIAHGRARTRSEAMQWLQDLLGITSADACERVTITDPSLTVDQYLALKNLPPSTRELFGLQDVRCWIAAQSTRKEVAAYKAGFFTVVYMPTGEGNRPRIRSMRPGASMRWATKVVFLDKSVREFGNDYKQTVYGLDQLQPSSVAPGVLMVVEGESDVHASHAMGVTNVVGVPGVQNTDSVRDSLLEACLIIGEGDPSMTRVVVWREPGVAGSQFPARVSQALQRAAQEAALSAPSVSTLDSALVGA